MASGVLQTRKKRENLGGPHTQEESVKWCEGGEGCTREARGGVAHTFTTLFPFET